MISAEKLRSQMTICQATKLGVKWKRPKPLEGPGLPSLALKKHDKFPWIPMILKIGLLLLLQIVYTTIYNTLWKNSYLYYVLIFHGNLDLFYYNIHAFLSSISLNIGIHTALLKHIQALYPIIASQHTLKSYIYIYQNSSSVLRFFFYFLNSKFCHPQRAEPETEYFTVMSSDRVSDFWNSTSKQKSIIE